MRGTGNMALDAIEGAATVPGRIVKGYQTGMAGARAVST